MSELAPPFKAWHDFAMMPSAPVHPVRIRRSVLCVPAANRRAIAKVASLACDCVIFDLEDSVAPEMKGEARQNLADALSQRSPAAMETIIRVNEPGSAFHAADMDCVLACRPDAVLIPKVEEPEDIFAVLDRLAEADAPESLRIWAMIETPKAILNLTALAASGRTQASRLDCLVVGLNDLRKSTGVLPEPGRSYLVPWLMQTVLAARAYGLDVIDSVSNDFKDLGAFAAECAQGRAMGFDGKMLIHPAQIDPANAAFGPSDLALREAQAIIAAFAAPDAAGMGVINMDGRMVERLHLAEAEVLVHKARMIAERKKA